MANIFPFRAFRPSPQLAYQVVELPYDVVSTEEARYIAAQRPYSFFHVSRAEVDFPIGQNPYAEEVYQKARLNLNQLIEKNILAQDPVEAFYVYQLKFRGRVQTGLVGLCAVGDYEKGLIKRHELTRSDKENDRVRHIEVCGAQTGLVFLAYRNSQRFKAELYKEIAHRLPELFIVTSDFVEHRIWKIDQPKTVQHFKQMTEEISTLFIADGHHRMQAAWRVAQSHPSPLAKYVMAGIFCEDELQILPYFRIIKNLPKDNFLNRLSHAQGFILKPSDTIVEPPSRHTFGIYYDKRWYELSASAKLIEETHPIKSLDVYILQEHLLKPVFGIQDPRTDDNLDFMGGIRGVNELISHCDQNGFMGITLFPTSMGEVINVADHNLIMPPKSTWFEPKLRSGFFVYRFG